MVLTTAGVPHSALHVCLSSCRPTFLSFSVCPSVWSFPLCGVSLALSDPASVSCSVCVPVPNPARPLCPSLPPFGSPSSPHLCSLSQPLLCPPALLSWVLGPVACVCLRVSASPSSPPSSLPSYSSCLLAPAFSFPLCAPPSLPLLSPEAPCAPSLPPSMAARSVPPAQYIPPSSAPSPAPSWSPH